MTATEAGQAHAGPSMSRFAGQDGGSTGRRADSKARSVRPRRAIADLRAAGGEDRRAQRHGAGPVESVDLTPKSAHEAITRQMVTDLAADVAEVKTRVNAVLWLLAGAVAIDVVLRLAGVG